MARTDKPAPILDLDKIETEELAKLNEVEPFQVKVGDQQVTFKTLEALDWETVEDLRQNFNVRDFLFAVIEDDDELNLFFSGRYSVAALERIMRGYYNHYGLEVPGETRLNRAARRQRR